MNAPDFPELDAAKMLQAQQLEEAERLKNRLLDFPEDNDPVKIEQSMANYGKLSQVRELLVQRFTRRVVTEFGSMLAFKRANGEKIPSDIVFVDKELFRLSEPMHKVIGSTTDPTVQAGLFRVVAGWIGEQNLRALLADVDAATLEEFAKVPELQEADLAREVNTAVADTRTLLHSQLLTEQYAQP